MRRPGRGTSSTVLRLLITRFSNGKLGIELLHLVDETAACCFGNFVPPVQEQGKLAVVGQELEVRAGERLVASAAGYPIEQVPPQLGPCAKWHENRHGTGLNHLAGDLDKGRSLARARRRQQDDMLRGGENLSEVSLVEGADVLNVLYALHREFKFHGVPWPARRRS